MLRNAGGEFHLVLANLHLVALDKIAGDQPAVIVSLRTSEGITISPGNAAWSTAKAGINLLTKQLELKLRNANDGRVPQIMTVKDGPLLPFDKAPRCLAAFTRPAVRCPVQHFCESDGGNAGLCCRWTNVSFWEMPCPATLVRCNGQADFFSFFNPFENGAEP